MIDPSTKDFITTFGPFLSGLFGGFVGIVAGHFLTKDRFRFEKTHEERLTVMKDIYASLSLLPLYMIRLISGRKELEEDIKERMEKFINYYSANKLFFDKSTASKIDNLSKELLISINHYDLMMSRTQNENREQIKEDYKRIEENIPELLKEIELDFRKILGIKH